MLAIIPPRLFLRSNKLKTITLINQTALEFDEVIGRCQEIFEKKNKDYGQSWRIMRISSIIDQIFIKANRIKTIEENGVQAIDEGVVPEWMGIINYCVMGLIQINPAYAHKNLSESELFEIYADYLLQTKNLMTQKNQDYGEIWRKMLVSTFTDMLLMRINRMHQIIENKGKTEVSEGVDSNLMDMINYAVFALIRLKEKN
jgi:hypothetical protein